MELAAPRPSWMVPEMEAAIPLIGQVCGRIDAVRPVRDVIEDTMSEFYSVIDNLSGTYA